MTEKIIREELERDIKEKGGNEALIEMVATMDDETLQAFHANFFRHKNKS